MLGTRPEVVTLTELSFSWFRTKETRQECAYEGWTVDGVPLRQLVSFPPSPMVQQVTPIRNGQANHGYEADYLRAILAEEPPPEFAVMPDGRVPLLMCEADLHLYCGTLTAEIVRGDRVVVWRDFAWQVCQEPIAENAGELSALTFTFDRHQYDEVVRNLLDRALSS